MNRRHLLLALALLVSAALGLLGEPPTGEGEDDLVAAPAKPREPVVPGPAAPARVDLADGAKPLVLRLHDRPPPVARLSPPPPESGLFRPTTWDPAPKPAAVAVAVAPPVPYTFIGKQRDEQGWSVFLSRGDDVRVARAGATLDGQYRVERIAPPQLVLTYLPMNQQQTLTIGSAE